LASNDDRGADGADANAGEDPTRELPGVPSGAAGDRCSSCNAPLAADQRYCVECGERRGEARFPVAPAPGEPAAAAAPARRSPTRPRVSSGATLVAGVATLLLAMGLGVLIGQLNSKQAPAPRSAGVQVVTVQEGAGTGPGVASTPATTTPATTTSAATTSTTGTRTTAVSTKAAKALAKPPSTAAASKASTAAGQVLGNKNNLAPPTVTTGQTCTSGAGCQGGHFTGGFFPGG
jgi:hypothetical protein